MRPPVCSAELIRLAKPGVREHIQDPGLGLGFRVLGFRAEGLGLGFRGLGL